MRSERAYIENAAAALEEPPRMAAGEARARSLACARYINVCLDAGQYDEARHQLAEAKRYALMALKLEERTT